MKAVRWSSAMSIFCMTPFPNIVYALDLNHDGKILWKYRAAAGSLQRVPIMCCDTVNRGIAYGDGKIFLFQADATLVALDAKTGKLIWSVKDGDPHKGATGTAAPFVIKDKVLVGVSGGEFGVRGDIAPMTSKTGKLAWRAYSEGPDKPTPWSIRKRPLTLGKPVGADSSLKTWQGDQWKIGGGATWGWVSYDPAAQSDLLRIGQSLAPGIRRSGRATIAGRSAIWARDADTGTAKWVYQMTPHDEWDYDGINEMILSDQRRSTAQHAKLLTHFDRNGFAYTLDRATGELLGARPYDPSVNWASGIDMDKGSKTYGRPSVAMKYSTDHNGEDTNTSGICPAPLGTKDEQPAAYSPVTHLFYVPTNHLCTDYEPFMYATRRACLMTAPRLRCIRRRATRPWAISSLSTRRPARSSGPIQNDFRSGRARSRRRRAWFSTARSKAI